MALISVTAISSLAMETSAMHMAAAATRSMTCWRGGHSHHARGWGGRLEEQAGAAAPRDQRTEQLQQCSRAPRWGGWFPFARRTVIMPHDMHELQRAMLRDVEAMLQRVERTPGNLSRRGPFWLMDQIADLAATGLRGQHLGGHGGGSSLLRALTGVEVTETNAAYTVQAAVPGFAKHDIKVALDAKAGRLTISGRKSAAAAAADAVSSDSTAEAPPAAGAPGGGPSESITTFTRTFSLPADVDLEQDITAKTENGLLTLVLPKAKPTPEVEEATERVIPVV